MLGLVSTQFLGELFFFGKGTRLGRLLRAQTSEKIGLLGGGEEIELGPVAGRFLDNRR